MALSTCHNASNSVGPTARRTHRGARRRHTVARLDFDRIFVESGPVLDPELRGAYRQRLMPDAYTP
ncbi:hypothetical protein, partial [Streptomyces griseus]|uniref:hypothetical protein n=1 Tax=Streptomyces griseus TaxID=1911 RepID=UPI001C598D93